MNNITIKDIAKLLEVNPSTVSRALKNHPDISEGMRKKVQQVAADLGYRPNYQAINFRQRKSGLIGLILPDMNMFFFPSVIKAIGEETYRNGYNLVVFQSGESLQKEIENIEMCKNFGVEGILVSVSKETNSMEHFESVNKNVPIVFFDKIVENQNFPSVTIQDEAAAFKAVSHLLEKGYRNICGLFDDKSLNITQRRFEGLQRALKEFGIKPNLDNCLFTRTKQEAREVFKIHLNNAEPIDCLFAMSDELLAVGMEVIYDKGIKVPEEIAVVSISDGDLPYFLNPKITHIHHSGYDVGKRAIRTLMNFLKTKNLPPGQDFVVDTHLVKLAST